MWKLREVRIDEIEVDLNLQMRAHEPAPEDYEEILRKQRGEWPFPPLRAIQCGDRLLLVEGFTRLRAATNASRTKVPIEVRKGSWADAVTEACGSNAEHGYRRTVADKRRAIVRAHEELSKSPTVIAKVCRVSRASVYTVLEELRPAAKKKAAATADDTVSADSVAPAPIRPAPVSALSENCPVCDSVDWTATDGGYECSVCSYEYGEVVAAGDEERDERASRRELIEEGVARDLATVSTDYGRLLRSLTRAGLGDATERPMLQIHKKLQEAIRAQRRTTG